MQLSATKNNSQYLQGASAPCVSGGDEMKKITAIILILVSLLVLCSSCSKKGSEEGEKTTITIWHDKEDAVIEVIERYLSSLDGIEVVFEKKSSLTDSLKLVGNDRSAAPDMYFFAHDKIGVYAEMGILSPITDFIGENELSSHLPVTLDGGMYKEVRYQLPLYYETLLFIYNKKYMKESEIPSTTEELYSYMEKKTKYGHYGFVEQHSTPYYASCWLHGFGTDYISDDGTPLLDTEATQKALEYHRKFVALMPGETEYSTINTLFLEGMAHSTIAGPWFIPSVTAKGIEVGVAAIPVVDETGLPISPYCGIQGFHVLKVHAEEKKDAITAVLRALMNTDLQVELALLTGAAPADGKAYENESVGSSELVMAMKETAGNAVSMPNIPEMDVMFSVAGSLLTDINMSGEDVSSACEKAQKKALELIEAMK